MRTVLIIAFLLVLCGCESIPVTIPIRAEHVSHATQHFGQDKSNFGYNDLSIGIRVKPVKRLSITISEGIITNSASYYWSKDSGYKPAYGGLMGPREVFSASLEYEIPLN